MPPFAAESNELLALSAFVSHQSKGLPIKVNIDGPAQPTYERGKALYFQRIGQINLACTHCHDRNWGKTLLAEQISQGQPNGWPAYRLEWQSLASLQRRLRACFYGVRAEQPAFGSEDLIALELYLAKRGEGLKVEVPGVRR
jgi:sulfur-oxidizing protein SoxA